MQKQPVVASVTIFSSYHAPAGHTANAGLSTLWPVIALTVIVLALFVAPSARAQTLSERDLLMPSAETSAMGGIHAASAEDLTTIFSNPAGFAAVPGTLNIAELNIGVVGPVFTIAGLALGGTSNILTSPSLVSLVSSLYAGLNIGGPLAFGYVGHGLGFGVFNNTTLLLSATGAGSVSLQSTERTLFAGGYAFRIPIAPVDGAVDIGLLLKGFVIGNVTVSGSLLTIDSLLSSLNPAMFTSNPLDITSGIGVDAGIRFSMWKETLAFAVSVTNLYTPAIVNHYASLTAFINGAGTTSAASNEVFPIDISFGVKYSPPLGNLSRYINALDLYFDYRNIFDFLLYPATAENIVLKFSVGAQVRLLQILSVRAGFARGLPSFGLGLDLTAFTLNAAIYGDELSTEPGLKSVYNLVVGFVFRM